MQMINKDYLYTEIWSRINDVCLPDNSLYIYAHDKEVRSEYCASQLKSKNPTTKFVEIALLPEDYLIRIEDGTMIQLNSSEGLKVFYHQYSPSRIYLEVTGMSCRLVAPLLKIGLMEHYDIHVVYSEPAHYKIKEFKKVGFHKDLSEDVGDIYALPGMEKLITPRKEPLFVTLLGFEGGRLTFLIENQQPSDDNIRPVIGVPGYRPNYPYVTYLGNRFSLINHRCWQEVKYAEANSIVDAYMTLGQISRDNRNPDMIVAPIGTKPHAIGAILYALKHQDKVELLYDNPPRTVHRTDGIGKILSCNVAKLFNEN